MFIYIITSATVNEWYNEYVKQELFIRPTMHMVYNAKKLHIP